MHRDASPAENLTCISRASRIAAVYITDYLVIAVLAAILIYLWIQ